MTTHPPPTLASVAQQFADWRQTRPNLKTPLPLRELVAGLPVPAFVTLPAALPPPPHDEAQWLLGHPNWTQHPIGDNYPDTGGSLEAVRE